MLVKIGRAKSSRKRLNAMQTGLPFKLEILYTLKVENPALVERTLHAMLVDTRVRGEWFEMPETPLSDLFDEAVERTKENAEPGLKERLPLYLPVELIDRVKNAVYWTPGLTLAGLGEEALRVMVERLEADRGNPFPPRQEELRGGRPLK
jgi:hypothetical protein